MRLEGKAAMVYQFSMNMKNNLLKTLAFVALAALLPTIVCGQNAKKQKMCYLVGQVKNSLTHELLSGARLTLMAKDSVVVDTARTSANQSANDLRCIYLFKLTADMPEYILKAEMEGYEPAFITLEATLVKGRGTPVRYAPAFLLKRKPKTVELGEVTVAATKVKFYTRGDTLVYNADAFQLADGSMLDGLIRQLPGAELRDNGRIYVNGKYVESLLLNGEDFFKGNNQIMLDILPAYMVKSVKVYDKASDRGEMLKGTGRRLGDETFVMDIKLKRSYNIGWIGNLEAGGGTHDRWLSRLFLPRFTAHSRLSAFANANNLNDTRRPGESTTWTPETMKAGNNTNRQAGLDYNIKEKDEHYTLKGSLTATHNDENTLRRTNAENYLSGQSSWTKAQEAANNHSWSLKTSHQWTLKPNRLNRVDIAPDLTYSRWRNASDVLSATFNSDPMALFSSSEALLDSIRQPSAGAILRRYAANRYLNATLERAHSIETNDVLAYDHYFDDQMNSDIFLRVGVKYSGTKANQFSRYRLDYPSSAVSASDYRNRYGRTTPNSSLRYSATALYTYWLSNYTYFSLAYSLDVTNRKHDYSLYRLDRLAGYGETDSNAIGTLPSLSEYEQTIDLKNSFLRNQTDVKHAWQGQFAISRWMGDDKDLNLEITLPMILTNSNMDYREAAYDGRLHKRTWFFSPSVLVNKMWNRQQQRIVFRYDLENETPDLVRFIDVRTDDDPLNITLGNPALKTQRTHTFELRYENQDYGHRPFSVSFCTWLYDNAVAMGYVYNRQMGVRTYEPYSVDGNRIFELRLNYSTPLDKRKNINIETKSVAQINRSVDMMTTIDDSSTADVNPRKSIVTNSFLREDLKATWKVGSVTFGANLYALYQMARSHREGFENLHVWNFHYGPTVKANLPWNMQLSSDLMIFSRRGYADSSVNGNDVVWNARLSKSIPKAHLTLMIDGFDMLHQLSNVSVTMNAQGRTEVYRNVLPNYFIFHVVYRFGKK